MLAAQAWQGSVERLERNFIGIRQKLFAENVESEQAFRSLTSFRRRIIDTHRRFVETRERVVAEMALVTNWVGVQNHTDGTSIETEVIPGPSDAARSRQQADPRNLPKLFEDIDQRMRAIMAVLAEEIQLLIGYAQVQDAKLMREQNAQTVRQTELALDLARATKRQAEWTILLAGLAAFYLSLTLVTGIYGMNIKEITGDGVPNKIWVLGSWAVAFVLTIGGCVAGYTSVKWWRRRKDESGKDSKGEVHRGMVEQEEYGSFDQVPSIPSWSSLS